MIQKHQVEYEEINLIGYIRTIKRHRAFIGKVALASIVIAMVVSVAITSPLRYKSEGKISLGKFQGELIESREEAISFLTEEVNTFKGVEIKEDDVRPKVIIVRVNGSSLEQAKSTLKTIGDALLNHHDALYKKKMASLEEGIQLTQKSIEENKVYLDQFQGGVSRFSLPFLSLPQATALQAYIPAYKPLIDRTNELNQKLRELELAKSKSEYKRTKIQTPLAPSAVFKGGTLLVSAAVGLLLGGVLGIFWAFGKEWWDKNKNLLK